MISFWAPGVPRSQGSKRAGMLKQGKGAERRLRATLFPDPPQLKQWRREVSAAAARAMPEGMLPLDVPVRVSVVFYFHRPASRQATHLRGELDGESVKATAPDLDKLMRAVGDSLQGIVVENDSRIVQWSARKVYAEAPGVRVVVEPIG